jgi:hypothetical protein
MLAIGFRRGFNRIEIDVDDVIKLPHHHTDSFVDTCLIERTIRPQVRGDVNAREVANGDFVAAGVQLNFGAEI